MNRTSQKLSRSLLAVWVAGAVTVASGQDTIVYSPGPRLPFEYGLGEPGEPGGSLAIAGAPAFGFQLGPFLCTTDIPISGCSGSYHVEAFGANAILQRSNAAALLSFGEWIGDVPPVNCSWSDPGRNAIVATHYLSPRYQMSALYGPLVDVGVGYLGVRAYAADGLHYAWIRLISAPSVAVIDWAYESRPGTPIRAGVIGSGGESLQFTVSFQDANHTPSEAIGAGTFILTGNLLRGELRFPDAVSMAEIAGPAPVRARPKPIATLGQPLARRTGFTSFFGETTLSHGEIVQLLRGALYVSGDDGALLGPISRLR